MAIRVGRGPERWMAWTLFGMSMSSKFYTLVLGNRPSRMEVDPVLFVIEAAVTTVMVAVALRANRNYTLWMAGFQIIALMAHFAKGAADQISPLAYVIMVVAPSYLQIITLGLGIWLHLKLVLRDGNYRSWRSSSPRSQAMPPMS